MQRKFHQADEDDSYFNDDDDDGDDTARIENGLPS